MRLPTEFLTPTDFEAFARRIVSISFGKEIIGFGEGKDDGIDGLDDINSPTIVVQAKRYQSRTPLNSFKKIVKREIDKIRNTAKKYEWNNNYEYVIVTSMDLNPPARKEIRDYAGSLIPSDKNIIDGVLLQDLADKQKFHETFVLYNLKEKKLIEQLENCNKEYIERESKNYFLDFDAQYYTETAVLYNAYETIDKYRLVILTGNPGVGKTTTCKMLGNLFTSRKDSEYLILERSIAEVQEVIDLFNKIYRDEKSKKLLVIFDDFLGRNSLDASEQQIKKLRNLYSILRYSENLYVILNSRTQIINTAKGDNLEFREFLDGKNEEKITINMSNYTDIEKAYIFRKNIEKVFSTKNLDEKIIMNEKYKDIIENENYLKIIKHQNFNPRLISLIASKSVESSGNYYEYCINSLHNPSRIYDELFRKLSNGAQYFLLSLYCFENYPVKLSQLEDAFNLLKMDKAYDLKQIEEDLEDSWIVIRNDETFENETINFANPSIIDYLSTKKSGLKPAFNKIANETKYLAQILKIEGGVGLYQRIKNNFDYYYDKYSYSGEKLNLIFKENNMFISEKEYRDLLYKFKGEYHNDAPPLFLSSHWDSLIESLYDSNNKTAQSIFLNELLFSSSNRLLINNIFQDVDIDIDNIAKNLDLLLLDFYNEGLSQNELINFSEEKTGLNLFAQISNYKKEQLQSKIDSFEDADSFLDLVDTISIEDEVESVTEEIVENYQEHLFKELRFSFFNNYIDEDDLDFSDFDSQVFDVAKDFFNTIDNDDDQEEYNIDKKSMEYTETLDTILGRPLL